MSSRPAQVTSSHPNTASADSKLRILRETVAATIALLIVLGTTVMLYIVFTRYVAGDDQTADKHFERAKDLLLFVNPLLGVVIGYYFNKVSTEARAEKAEATVEMANTNAQQAISDRNEATEKAGKANEALKEVIPAAEKMLDEGRTRRTGTLSAGGAADQEPSAWSELAAAVERAKRVAE
jgi:hypothetical protein